ncbi:MAG: transcription termination/antitermination NusG family protein, partial [bacterium]|nr:transcription termination/antitermination NusG family protein [bacterium]
MTTVSDQGFTPSIDPFATAKPVDEAAADEAIVDEAIADELIVEAVDEAVVEELVIEDAVDEVLAEAEEIVEEEEEEEDPLIAFREQMRISAGDWYVIHSYAGYENKVKGNIETRINSMNMEDYIFQVEVPMEEVTEIKSGVRKLVRRNKFPGYVLVRMELTDESWGAIRHTPGVTGFVGHGHQPAPLTLDEVVAILAPTPEKKAGAPGAPSSSG